MNTISKELKRVEKLINTINGKIFRNRRYKDDLEWWVLGKISEILKMSSLPYPIYAEKKSPPDPDFLTYDKSRNIFKYIEITEVLEPTRKRSDEYREMPNEEIILEDEPNAKLSLELMERIKAKLLKRYGKNTWLFIYFDISYSSISPYGYWHKALMTNLKVWKENKEINLNDQIYKRIFITDAPAEALIQIYPKIQTIKPEEI